jgi:SAM-dependent methyltransferase
MPLPPLERGIPPTYQMDALLRGRAFQRAWHRARLDLAAAVLPPAPGGLLLDVAAGAGIVTWRFPQTGVVSVDLRPEACRAIREHTPGARALVAELAALPFGTGRFAQTYFLETIEHLSPEHGVAVLRELRRTASPGGRCLVTTPNYASYWTALERVLDALRLTPPMASGQHISRYDAGALQAAAKAAGWRVLRLGSFNLAAPVAGLVSARLGARAVDVEARHAGRAGALLFALCEAA